MTASGTFSKLTNSTKIYSITATLTCKTWYISFSVKFPVYQHLGCTFSRQNSQRVLMHKQMQSSGQMQISVSVLARKYLCKIQAIVFEKVSLHVSSIQTQQITRAGSTTLDLVPQLSYHCWKSFIVSSIIQRTSVHVYQKAPCWKKVMIDQPNHGK